MQAAQFNAREILTRFRGGAGAPLPPDDYQQNLDQSNFYQDPAVTKPRHQNNIQVLSLSLYFLPFITLSLFTHRKRKSWMLELSWKKNLRK